MPYFIIFLMCLFFIIGLGLVIFGSKEIWRKFQLKNRLVRTTGVVHTVEQKRTPTSEGRVREHRHQKPIYMFFPVIGFQLPTGESVAFKSETGDNGHRSKYSAGQRVPVIYDPLGEVPPMIDDWFGLWGISVSVIVGGVVFMGAASMLLVAFGA